jgi:hypothetical protein
MSMPTEAQMPAGASGPRRGPLVPALIAVIVVLVAAVVLLVVTRDGDDEQVATTEPAPTSSVDETTVVPTVAVTTTSEAPATTVAATTLPPTTVPATVPPTTGPPLTSVTPGQALALVDGTTLAFSLASTCEDFWAGVGRTSHALIDPSGVVWVVDVLSFEEGGPRLMFATDMTATIAVNVFGRDSAIRAPRWSGSIDESVPGVVLARLDLLSGDGPASIEVAVGDPTTPGQCALGSFEQPSPFGPGNQVQWRSPDDTIGVRFNVLAQCGGELVLSGGGLLTSSPPEAGGFMSTVYASTGFVTGEDDDWWNVDGTDPTEFAFEMGGGGDALAAINLYRAGDRSTPAAYLQWSEPPPASAVGAAGLIDIPCSA